jgi:hypothetical protein
VELKPVDFIALLVIVVLLAVLFECGHPRRSGGGQKRVRNAPPMPRHDRIPDPPPRGRKRT